MLPICLILVILSVGTSFCQSEFALSGQSEGISSCRTVGGPSPGKPCQFPFIFGGTVRHSCISDTDPEARLWCSTRVDTAGLHVGGGGHWGYCPPTAGCGSHTGQIQLSDNFVASSAICVTGSGKSGLCVPPSACVGVNHNNIDADVCSLTSGGQGLCCQSNVKNNIINLPSAADNDDRDLGIPSISSAELDSIFQEVSQGEEERETTGINTRNGSPKNRNQIPESKPKTPSFFHHKFNSPREDIVNFDKEARKLVKVTQRLKELKNLTDSQASIGLRSGFNSVTSQRIRRLCPWTNPVPVCDKNNKFR